MTKRPQKLRPWKEKLKDNYRFVVLSDESISEVANYRLSLLNVYIIICSCLVILGIIILSLIAFTPLKKFIPGYGSLRDNKQMIQIDQNLNELEASLEAYTLYFTKFRKMLTVDELPNKEESAESQIAEILINTELDKLNGPEPVDNPNAFKTPGGSEKFNELEEVLFVPPVNGSISAKFMTDLKHFGIDILAPKDTPVKATLDGFVIISGWDLETGNTVGIQHSNNLVTFYKHNSALLKEAGTFVRAGEAVAIIGNSGTLSDGPHLHFELWFNGQPVDPENYINF